MQPQVQLRFSGMFPSEAAAAAARRLAHRLTRAFDFVAGWEVTFVRPPHIPAHPGGCYAVRVQALLPEAGVAGARAHGPDLNAALRDAFDAVEGELGWQHGSEAPGAGPDASAHRPGSSAATPATQTS